MGGGVCTTEASVICADLTAYPPSLKAISDAKTGRLIVGNRAAERSREVSDGRFGHRKPFAFPERAGSLCCAVVHYVVVDRVEVASGLGLFLAAHRRCH